MIPMGGRRCLCLLIVIFTRLMVVIVCVNLRRVRRVLVTSRLFVWVVVLRLLLWLFEL